MMLHVIDVIFDEEMKRDRGCAANAAGDVGKFLRDAGNHLGEMEVIQSPEFLEVRPVGTRVALGAGPAFLLVSGRVELALEDGPDETLMVIAGRVDEVADGFLFRPLRGGRLEGDIRFRELIQML